MGANDVPFFLDGILIGIAVLVAFGLHLRRLLAPLPRWLGPALGGLALLALALRLGLSHKTIMNAWPYERVVPLARLSYGGFILPGLFHLAGVPLFLTDVIFTVDLVIAVLTPVVLFAHAMFVLRDWRPSLFAAFLLVVLPDHIRFSWADTEIIQSICSSSLTFIVLYTALREESPRWRNAALAMLPILSLATYWVRPENMVFYGLDVFAILLTAGPNVTWRRRLIVLGEVTVAGIIAFTGHLMTKYGGNLREGLSWETVDNFRTMFVDTRLNTLINPQITPPGLVALVAIGAYALLKKGELWRTVFLIGWVVGLFFVHSYVLPTAPEMQARYHLNLLTPTLMLASASLFVLLPLRTWVIVPIVLYFGAAPFRHRSFIQNTAFNEMVEFDFLMSMRDQVPPGCTLLEFSPAIDTSDPEHVFASRLGRIGSYATPDGHTQFLWNVVQSGKFKAPTKSVDDHEELTPEAQAVLCALDSAGPGCADLPQDKRLSVPPRCVYVYEGLSCRSHRAADRALAPVCEQLRERLDLKPVATKSFAAKVYDEVNAGRVIADETGRTHCIMVLGDDAPVELGMFEARPRSTPPQAEAGSTP
jgi:hypothetical protein